MLYDLIIRDALVIDGSDVPGFRSDVAIHEGRILRVGDLDGAKAKEEINAALKEASETSLKGILRYTTEELVSVDFMGMRYSSCLDSALTNVIGNTVKVVSWYDNEAGFSNRVLDLVKFVGSKGL